MLKQVLPTPVVGHFVWTKDADGIGKLVSIDRKTGQCRVRFQTSITVAEEKTYRLADLQRCFLSPQTRVYHHDLGQDLWRMGRVVGYVLGRKDRSLCYDIQFPNKRFQQIPEAALEVRCLRPASDPTEVLATGGMESQFWHDRRMQAISSLAYGRAVSHGLSGLLSASIWLLPHQVEVVRRVLEDPIQRYLLADEVGLGKTIEAGCILRQHLIDNPEDHALVLCPSPLVQQWQRELAEKFSSADFGDRMTVKPFEALPSLSPGSFQTLVVDEAHYLTSPDYVASAQFAHLTRLAHATPRLLLLTATPLLGNNDTLLALLHLLDPHVYKLEEGQQFKEKVARRQEYGQILLALNPEAGSFVLRSISTRLLQAFAEDSMIADLAPKLAPLQGGPDRAAVAPVIRSLKRHIAETYRIYQRLIRTRRKELPEWVVLPRDGVVSLHGENDPRFAEVWDALEEWRQQSRASLSDPKNATVAQELERQMANRYLLLCEALGCGVGTLSEELDLPAKEAATGRPMTFDGEEDLLAALKKAAAQSPKGHSRLRVAASVIADAIAKASSAGDGHPTKVVAFTSSSQSAEDLSRHLKGLDGNAPIPSVLAYSKTEDMEKAVRTFWDFSEACVLLCDRSTEEGLNLQLADAIVHLDLPFAPSRLEQRIGRLDRFGRHLERIQHHILLPTLDSNSAWMAWQQLLQEAFHLYHESISDVQFLLERLQGEIALALYQDGAAGLAAMSQRIRDALKAERIRLDEQYALDRLEMAEAGANSLFEQLDDADDVISRYEALNGWLREALKFWMRPETNLREAFRLHWTKDTLVPKEPWQEILKTGLDRPLTYRRSTAVYHPEARLVRPGSPLVEGLVRFMRWDDRGTAFATWRVDKAWKTDQWGEWMGFRLCYQVEADVEAALKKIPHTWQVSDMRSIRRRADALMPPWVEEIYLDESLSEVIAPHVLEMLGRHYDKGQRDYNLGSRQDALFALVNRQRFHQLCQEVRDRSQELLIGNSRYQERALAAARGAQESLVVHNQQLRRRNAAIANERGQGDPTIDVEIAINDAINEAILRPKVKLDAIGFFVISDSPPQGQNDDE
ncbi:MAG: hypothetical protein EXR82_07125 [Gammaproteobacteria bacterium]|nr:hypothetical protein [Gammaproteobacteria bacterium]